MSRLLFLLSRAEKSSKKEVLIVSKTLKTLWRYKELVEYFCNMLRRLSFTDFPNAIPNRPFGIWANYRSAVKRISMKLEFFFSMKVVRACCSECYWRVRKRALPPKLCALALSECYMS